MSKKGYYRTVKEGSGKMYQCVVCGKLGCYAPEAKNCCLDKKPAYSIDEVRAIAEAQPELLEHLKNTCSIKPLGQRTRWGHRGRASRPNLFDEYHKAFARIEGRLKWQECKHLADLFESDDDWTRALNAWAKGKPGRTPLQHLAWAFYNHNWEQVKAAAYALSAEYLAQSDFGEKVHQLLLKEADNEQERV